MDENVRKRIDEVRDYLTKSLDDIAAIETKDSNGVIFQGILYSTFIDSLSSTLYKGEVKGNRQRFTKLVREHSGWIGLGRVCPLHLQEFCRKHQEELPKLKETIDAIMDHWVNDLDSLFYLDESPTYDEIKELWPQDGNKKIAGKKLENFLHCSLLYGLRNGLVHENYAKRGLAIFQKERQNAHYVGWRKYDPDSKQFDLIHPAPFLDGMCRTLLGAVINQFEEQETMPWPSGHFNEYLIEDL